MATAFEIAPDGSAKPLPRWRCRNEDRDLQQLLAKTPDLLPGDQIDPEDPRRWLLVRRELAVPDPSTGADRWSIDHVFADQDAIPTLVECKRFVDARARREVVGQMLEYAANGHHYWQGEQLQQFAEETARQAGQTLEEALARLCPDDEVGPEDFFKAFVNHLREGRVRLVFFMDEAPAELKSIAEFLNRQMELAEVLVVEARHFESEGTRIVIPSLFGYTEEARLAKREASAARDIRRRWTAETFREDALVRLSDGEIRAVERLLTFAREQGVVRWGNGRARGSFTLIVPEICRRSILSVKSDGVICWNFPYFGDDDRQVAFRTELAERLVADLGADIPLDQLASRYPMMPIAEWGSRVETLQAILAETIESHRKLACSLQPASKDRSAVSQDLRDTR
jgi:hypothetical protein